MTCTVRGCRREASWGDTMCVYHRMQEIQKQRPVVRDPTWTGGGGSEDEDEQRRFRDGA